MPAPENARRRPGVAFVLSLILPGLGHLYCRKNKTAALTAIFFSLAIAGAFFLREANPFWGPALRASLILYTFAFLDAFYTAREINAGMEPFIVGNNPRIAAMLNLVTNGFGYFYLGERKKGLIWFFALRIFSGIVQQNKGHQRIVLSTVAELVLLIISIDAYRLARSQMRSAFPDSNLDPFAPATGLIAAVPIAVACLFAANYAALVVLGVSMPDYVPIDQSVAIIRNSSQSVTYSNVRYQVELTAPQGWDLDNKKADNQFVKGQKHEGGCSVQLIAQANNPIFGSGADALRTAVLRDNKEFHLLSDQPVVFAGLPGRKLNFSAKFNRIDVTQTYFIAQKRLTQYAFIETMATLLADDCNPDFAQIRAGLKLLH